MNGKPVNVAMKRALARSRLLIPALLLLAGCSWSIPKSGGSGTAEPPPAVPQAPAPPADPIHERLKTMTADQKIGQLLMAGIEGTHWMKRRGRWFGMTASGALFSTRTTSNPRLRRCSSWAH
ncbi:hypothetical protein LJK88_02185 [Paenibacillus sp. P26]|nr:hypothetical protein LJK88_02185 [Paenibacillus sp. P26]